LSNVGLILFLFVILFQCWNCKTLCPNYCSEDTEEPCLASWKLSLDCHYLLILSCLLETWFKGTQTSALIDSSLSPFCNWVSNCVSWHTLNWQLALGCSRGVDLANYRDGKQNSLKLQRQKSKFDQIIGTKTKIGSNYKDK
jgi:hypothetical protein